MRSIIAILLCAVMCSTTIKAQTGPGGVGNSTNNTLWLKADAITGLSAGDTLTTAWPDASGNANNASQATHSYRPTYQNSGDIASLRFDGADDHLDNNLIYNARTVFAIYNTSISLMQGGDLGQLWGNYGQSMHVAVDARSGSNLKGWSFDGQASGGTSAKYALNGANYNAASAGNNNSPWEYDQWGLVSTEFSSTKGITRQVIGSLYPAFVVGDHQFGGDIAELIVYNTTLNLTQRIIVENYLASKYALTLSQNDKYSYDVTHKYDVAGLGRTTSGDTHTAALSAGLLQVTSGAGLDADGEFLLFGHDGTGSSSWSTTEAPTGMERLGQEWRFDETGDLGTVTLSIDTTMLTSRSAGYDRLFLLVSSTGDMSSGATSYELLSVGGDIYATDIDIADGDYVAVAALKPEVSFVTATSQGFENDVTDTIYIQLNHALDGDVTVDYAVTGGTAAGSGVDYTLTAGTATILGGETQTYIVIDLVDEVTLESTETVEITLSNLSAGSSLGTPSVHTYSINDNDADRDIDFTISSATGTETAGTVNLTLRIDQVDLTQITTIDYSVTGGTATGSGTDFTLAAGTATIAAGDLTTTISLSIVDDATDEDDETLVISLTNPSNANVGTNNVFTYTIQDNDSPPTVAFTQSNSAVNEDAGTANLTVSLSAASSKTITLNYALGAGTATSGVDFNMPGSSLSFAAGETSKQISIAIINDTDEESSETVLVSLSSPTNATLSGISSYTLTINSSDLLGTGGPSGVGSAGSNSLWLMADDITGVSDGAAISGTWADASGNSNGASQSNGTYQPKFASAAVNGHAAVTFDGVDDYFDDNRSYSARTLFIVYKTDSASQSRSELAQLWGNYAEGVHVAPDPRTAQQTGGFSFDGDNSLTASARYALQGDDYTGSFYSNTSVSQWSYDEWTLVTVEFDQTYDITRQVIGSLVPQFSAGTHQFGGQIAEMIVYNTTINNARKDLVENYLAAKYDLTIATDLFNYESTHGNDVFGIGAETASIGHFHSQSKEVLTIGSPSDLEADEYLLIGNNAATLDSFATNAVSGISGISILPRQWRVSETGNVGSITLTIDTTVLPAKPVGETQYLVFVDSDGDPSNGATVYRAVYNNGVYEVEDLYLNEGNYLSIATAANVSVATGSFSTGATWVTGTAPVSGEPAIIAVGNSITLGSDVTTGAIFLSGGATLNAGTYDMDIDEGSFIAGGIFNAGIGTVNYNATADQTIAEVAYYELNINGSGTKSLTENITIQSDLVINNATFDAGVYNMDIGGAFKINSGSFNAGTGMVNFVGTSPQNITTKGSAFYGFTLNNTTGATLLDDVEVSNTLILTDGVLSTGANRIYVSATGNAAVTGFSSSSFVNGNLRRGMATDTDTYDFPVGNGTTAANYFPASLDNNNLTGISYIDAKFIPLANHLNALLNVTSGALTISEINTTGVWRLDPDQQPSGGNYSVALSTTNFTGLVDNDFIVVKRPSLSVSGADWSTGGGTYPADNTYGRLVADGEAIVSGLTSFSEFGAGSGTGAALPIELIYFTATLNSAATVDLNWATAVEINNEHFTIERSANGTDFKELIQVAGAGTTNDTKFYSTLDSDPLKGTSYYRLKQTDTDGGFEYSDIAVVNNSEIEELDMTIFPNPASGRYLNIDLGQSNSFITHDSELEPTTISIVDVLGRNVVQQTVYATNRVHLQLPEGMATGTYYMQVQQADKLVKQPFMYK